MALGFLGGSAGDVDTMVNFYLEDDAGDHTCEVPLVHTQLYVLRKNTGVFSICQTSGTILCGDAISGPERAGLVHVTGGVQTPRPS